MIVVLRARLTLFEAQCNEYWPLLIAGLIPCSLLSGHSLRVSDCDPLGSYRGSEEKKSMLDIERKRIRLREMDIKVSWLFGNAVGGWNAVDDDE